MATVLQTLLAVVLTSRRDKVNYWVSKALVSGLYESQAGDKGFSHIPAIAGGSILTVVKIIDDIDESAKSTLAMLHAGSIRSVLNELPVNPDIAKTSIPTIAGGVIKGLVTNENQMDAGKSSVPSIPSGKILRVVVNSSVIDAGKSSTPILSHGVIYAQ